MIVLPIILEDSGEVLLFKTFQEAERYTEPVDVTDKVYRAYDSQGHRLQLQTSHKGKVVISCIELTVYEQELREIIIGFLKRVDLYDDSLLTADITEIVSTLADYRTD